MRTRTPHTLNLKRLLLLRVSLFALALCLLTASMVIGQARAEIAKHVQTSGLTMERLIARETFHQSRGFDNSLGSINLAPLDGYAPLTGLCLDLLNLSRQLVQRRCLPPGEPGRAAPAAVAPWLMQLLDNGARYRGPIVQPPGVRGGDFVLSADLAYEASRTWVMLSTVLAMGGGVLLLNLLVYLPVRRALLPTDDMLATLERLQGGELSARMPNAELDELQRISSGVNHLAEQLELTAAEQRRLSQGLLSVREDERRTLARELHDEFGQCLTSIRADAAAVTAALREVMPSVLPATEAIDASAARLMELVQGILQQLRPPVLDTFGLRAGLEQLVQDWQRLRPDCCFELDLQVDPDALPHGYDINIYRIAQESLTNADRHGRPARVSVSLSRQAGNLCLTIKDDGQGGTARSAGSGLGLLGMRERVWALGGQLHHVPLQPHGMRVSAVFPQSVTQLGEDMP